MIRVPSCPFVVPVFAIDKGGVFDHSWTPAFVAKSVRNQVSGKLWISLTRTSFVVEPKITADFAQSPYSGLVAGFAERIP